MKHKPIIILIKQVVYFKLNHFRFMLEITILRISYTLTCRSLPKFLIRLSNHEAYMHLHS